MEHKRRSRSRSRERKKPRPIDVYLDMVSTVSKHKEEDQKSETEGQKKKVEKQKPCFEASGILAAERNTVNGVVLKFTEPLDAKLPTNYWRIYPYKDETALPVLYMHDQTCFLFGRDRRVADIPTDHQSCSGQHAVWQYREKATKDLETGEWESEVKPYLMDLESTNGTFLNGTKMEPARYYEIKDGDLIKFGTSTRDYVVVQGKGIRKGPKQEE